MNVKADSTGSITIWLPTFQSGKPARPLSASKEMLEDIYEVLVRDFKAKYVVVGKQHPLAYYLEKDARFDKKLETGREVVYLVK